MVVKKRGLGRGLDALLSGIGDEAVAVPVSKAKESFQSENNLSVDGELKHLPLGIIQRGRYQPRRDIEPQALEELAASIKNQGIMQPIVVRTIDDGRYEIIAGERRWRAAQLAGLQSIPVLVREVADEAASAMALIENLQRENLNPMEEAIALHRLQTEFELTQQQVADTVGKSRSAISNLLRLMNLTDAVKKRLEHGDIEMGHARALLALEDELQISAAEQVIHENLSVRETEHLVKKISAGEPLAPVVKTKKVDESLQSLSGSLSRHFSTPVKITENAQGKGKISISYASAEQLEQIIAQLQANT
ncbi:chromosome partitioning protein ParB [Nitrincola tibetensis]|uniref:Probable chromosome-partitioning protein ParB n=1 Tax=Nitrincola tibetensis TaxID=2219697 RepID=A0A364NM31_9GAMM|nr:ParB/RepB/Spo0J family partition protein [Nitrincola tibetensis]RAU18050.1 chromosome partitioning protein ParB [Nitrincola tibetensis]